MACPARLDVSNASIQVRDYYLSRWRRRDVVVPVRRSTHSPVKGLTADILVRATPSPIVLPAHRVTQIMAAEIAFDKPTTFERNAPGQRPFNEMIDALVEDHRTQQHAEGPKTEPVT